MWDHEPAGSRATLTIAGEYQSAATAGSMLGQRVPAADFPPLCQLPRSVQDDQSLIILSPIRTQAREWAMLALRGWHGESLTTGTENLMIQAALLGATLDRNTVLTALTEQQSTLHAAYNRERMLSQTIRELGCPIIPLLPGVLLVPLMGAIDSQRAQQIIGGVLDAIGEERAYMTNAAIVEITSATGTTAITINVLDARSAVMFATLNGQRMVVEQRADACAAWGRVR